MYVCICIIENKNWPNDFYETLELTIFWDNKNNGIGLIPIKSSFKCENHI